VSPGAVSQFQVGPSTNSVTPGTNLRVTITAQDAYGNRVTGYQGTVHFTSSDGRAVLPGDYTFTTSDAGKAVVRVELNTLGSQTLTVTDTASSVVAGTSSAVLVTTITNVQLSQYTQTSIVITWNTTVPETGQLFYRVQGTSAWQASPLNTSYLTSHQINLSGLQRGTGYEFWVQTFDQNGLESDSQILSFRTLR
jgi:hypothetical protein